MKIYTLLFFLLYLCSINLSRAQSNVIYTSRVNLEEKQNRLAEGIPELLLKAYSRGDILPRYPEDLDLQAGYLQFLNHFGMAEKASFALASQAPPWYCRQTPPVPVDGNIVHCFSQELEIGERKVRNPVTYQQEQKFFYVKLIFPPDCTGNGLEKAGPIFLFKDIEKLKSPQYRLKNPANPSVDYTIAQYLLLRAYRAK